MYEVWKGDSHHSSHRRQADAIKTAIDIVTEGYQDTVLIRAWGGTWIKGVYWDPYHNRHVVIRQTI